MIVLLAGCYLVPPDADESVCEAMCSWAVTCHGTERALDDAAYDDCLQATYGVDRTCEDVDVGALSFAGFQELSPCIDAVDDRRRDHACDPFTGSESAILTGTAPAQCIGAGRDAGAVFDAAREATREPGASLCRRVAAGLCDLGAACQLDGTATTEDCADALDPVFTSQCVDDGQLDADDTTPNPLRDAARGCLATSGLELVECSDLAVDGDCAAMFAPGQHEAVTAALANL